MREYLSILRKRWASIATCVILAMVAAVILSIAATPQYKSTTRLFFAVPAGETISDLAQGSSFTEKQMSSYVEVATSPLVLGQVVDSLGLDTTYQQLRSKVSASVPTGTVIVEITARSEHPAQAAAIADAAGSRLAAVVATLYPTQADGSQSVLATTLSPAEEPSRPYSPNAQRNAAMGLAIGLGVGIAFALTRESLDTRIRSVAGVAAQTDRAVLGGVSFDAAAPSHPVVMVDKPGSQRAEEIRRLRTNLQFVDIGKGARTIVVSSSIAGEGKTTTLINLAVALADTGKRVAVVDADLRRPAVHRVTGLEATSGLTTVLIGRAQVDEVLQPWLDDRISVLTSGPLPPNPSELLASRAMIETLERLKADFDVVLIDSPPLLPVTDAAVVASRVDGTVLVVGVERTHRQQLRESLEALKAVDANVLGIVINKLPGADRSRYGSQYTYGDTDARKRDQSRTQSPNRSARRHRTGRAGRRRSSSAAAYSENQGER